MPVSTHKHWAILLTAIGLLLAQFIAELIGVFILFSVTPSIATYFYKFVIYLVVVHIVFSVVLIVFGRQLAKRFYKPR